MSPPRCEKDHQRERDDERQNRAAHDRHRDQDERADGDRDLEGKNTAPEGQPSNHRQGKERHVQRDRHVRILGEKRAVRIEFPEDSENDGYHGGRSRDDGEETKSSLLRVHDDCDERDRLRVFGREDWFAPVASGSNPADAMVICPCTMGSLAAIACGLADNLIERAADVMLKERRPLILVPRETPLSVIHLENMLRLARAGAVILPANPGFYHQPSTIEGLVDFVVGRVLDQLRIAHRLLPRWGEAATLDDGRGGQGAGRLHQSGGES